MQSYQSIGFLCAIGGLLLGSSEVYANQLTGQYLSITQAQKILFSNATEFIAKPLLLNDQQIGLIQTQSGLKQRWQTQQAWKVFKNNQSLGWFIVDDVIGKHEFITYAVAIADDGKVLGIEILTYRETHGGQIRDAVWRQNFSGKTVQDEFKLDKDIPNIVGATLSCRNVMSGVKRLLVIHQNFLKGI